MRCGKPFAQFHAVLCQYSCRVNLKVAKTCFKAILTCSYLAKRIYDMAE